MRFDKLTRVNLGLGLVQVFLSTVLYAAQPAKTPPAKDPPIKSQPVDEKNSAWKLAGREGECAPLDILGKRGPAYGDIKSPKELVDKLKANGYEADMKEFKAGLRPAVEVRAPAAGIHVMFVRQEHCDKKPPAPPAK